MKSIIFSVQVSLQIKHTRLNTTLTNTYTHLQSLTHLLHTSYLFRNHLSNKNNVKKEISNQFAFPEDETQQQKQQKKFGKHM